MRKIRLMPAAGMLLFAAIGAAAPTTLRLYNGVTLHVDNADGRDFEVTLQVRDLNLLANGPREMLFKVYTPDGRPAVREVIPDDGVVAPAFLDRTAGWDHELMSYANLYAKGTVPTVGFSAWSDPARLETLKARSFTRSVKGGGKGVYRILLAGFPDHVVTVGTAPELPCAVGGHPSFLHGRGNAPRKEYVYVPPGTAGLFFVLLEPDLPRGRSFKLTAPDGKVLFDGMAEGGYVHPDGPAWQQATAGFADGGYDGKLLTFEVSPQGGDYMVHLALVQPKKGVFKEYVGMGSQALFASTPELAMALKGGTFQADGELFWHPFQARLHAWLKAHPAGEGAAAKEIRALAEELHNGFRLIETGDGRGSATWNNWAYSFGYYGCKIWRPGWLLMQRADAPAELKEIVREGLLLAGDRLSFAAGMERVNGNAFAQINVALWYCHQATGDALQKALFETFWKRWSAGEGWGVGSGLSRSGDAQEHFAHDMHYGSYLLDNWLGGTWVKPGILTDAEGKDPRFRDVVERYRELYSYLYCRDGKEAVPANPWSARTHMAPHQSEKNWEPFGHPWKGEPGPDFTVSVNGGDEWFAARRSNYYLLTFHGRLAPEWLSRSFEGQVGFGGGAICQLTVPAKGPVLASTLHGSYGKGMDPSEWRAFHLHTLAGEMWDGRPLIAAISDHEGRARLDGNAVVSTGEVRDAHVKATRRYVYQNDGIECSVSLAESDYARTLSIWSHERKWSQVRLAYEIIPFLSGRARGKEVVPRVKATVDGKELGPEPVVAQKVRLDRGGYGVDILLPEPMPVQLGKDTVMVRITDREVPADKVALTYRLVPYRE